MLSAHDPPSIGATLPHWLDRLDHEGFHIGTRERLVAHELLARLAACGELPRSETQALALLAPLLCTSPESQRRYAKLLQQFVALQPQQRPVQAQVGASDSDHQQPDALWSGRTKLGLAALLLAACTIAAIWFMLAPQHSPMPAPAPQASAPMAPPPASQPLAAEIARPIYVPLQPLSIQSEPVAPAWGEALRIVFVTLGALCLLALAGVVWMRLQRALYLHGTRCDEDLQERVLSDPQGPAVPAPAALLRTVARGLRQRVAGEREVLDLKATLQATVRAAGAFSPRLRRLHLTPEYVALIDRHHPLDHQAAWSELLLQALQAQGVTVHVWYFEGTPLHGCWRLRQGKSGALEVFNRLGMAELAARHAGHRLLVLAETQALVEPLTGRAQIWSRELNAFPQRAWFTPQPIVSWGTAEQLADAQGFLVLPLQPEALTTLANWLASEDLSLAVGADWPLVFPPLLAQDGTVWAARQSAPPPGMLGDLLFQLRAYLGAERFQWLCACAIFPALSPPLTLALGRALTDDTRRLALGMAALSALPWFRHGHMPAWLRMALVERLDKESGKSFRAVIEQRLAQALEEGQSNVFVTLAVRRRLLAWLARGRGVTRDVVLVSFLHCNVVSRLAQRLPDVLRRRLFRNGLPLQGLRQGVVVYGLLPGAMLLGAAVPWVWQTVASFASGGATQAAVSEPHRGHEDKVTSVAFSPDGSRIVSGSDDRTLRLWDVRTGAGIGAPLRGHEDKVTSVAFSPDGRRIVSGSWDTTLRLWDARTGASVGTPLQGHEAVIWSVAFSPDGSRIVSGSDDRTLRLWNARTGASVGVPLQDLQGRTWSVAFSPDGSRIVSGSASNILQIWDARTGASVGAPLRGHEGEVTSVAFSPDGSRIVSGSWDKTLRLWDARTGASIGAPLRGHEDKVTSVAFSPDGSRIVSSSADMTLRLWDAHSGASVGAPLRGHEGEVTSVAFSPDGSHIVSGSWDKTLRLWGTKPTPRIEFLGCGNSNSVDTKIRVLVNAIAKLRQFDLKADDRAESFEIAAYSLVAWAHLHPQQPPVSGEIRHAAGDEQQRRQAQVLQTWLSTQQNQSDTASDRQWTVRAADSSLEAVTVNACEYKFTQEELQEQIKMIDQMEYYETQMQAQQEEIERQMRQQQLYMQERLSRQQLEPLRQSGKDTLESDRSFRRASENAAKN
jgi:WD40 repeat protein